MGYTLQRVEQSYGNTQPDWLASAHGLDAADSITLDAAALLAVYPTGDVPSGIEVSRAASGRYVPGSTGSAPGFLVEGVRAVAGQNPVGALLWHGEVIAARVPGGVTGTHPNVRIV